MTPRILQEEDLEAVLAKEDAKYDEEVGLLRGAVGQVRYHTRLPTGTPIHPTNQSLGYAAASVASSDPVRHERARRIVRTVLSLQDQNPESAFCGVWPWFLEEPIEQMAPPDMNWADFLGVHLLQILTRPAVLPELASDIRKALRLAACAIRKRNVRLSYTNIAIMGTYVTIAAGQILEDATLLEYGRDRLRRFVEFTREFGGFPEYNSPTYTIISIIEASRMFQVFTDPADLELAREIHEMLWEEVATHWHAPSRQWAGPHSRSYSTLLTSGALGFIQRALGDQVQLMDEPELPSIDSALVPIQCPDSFVSYFAEANPMAHREMTVSRGEPDLIGHTHMEPGFVLSSAERSSFWNQSRGLLAYAPSADGPVAMAVQFLHDGYDFCSANVLTRQEDSRVLAGICLAFDGGDKHPELDRYPDGVIGAEDWRIRFDLLNVKEVPESLTLDQPWTLAFGESALLQIRWLHAVFGDEVPRVEVTKGEHGSRIDLVLYSGQRREFRFKENFPMCFGLALRIASEANGTLDDAEAIVDSDHLRLKWGTMQVMVAKYPTAEAEVIKLARAQKLSRK